MLINEFIFRAPLYVVCYSSAMRSVICFIESYSVYVCVVRCAEVGKNEETERERLVAEMALEAQKTFNRLHPEA